jgi:hypothetical protein
LHTGVKGLLCGPFFYARNEEYTPSCLMHRALARGAPRYMKSKNFPALAFYRLSYGVQPLTEIGILWYGVWKTRVNTTL